MAARTSHSSTTPSATPVYSSSFAITTPAPSSPTIIIRASSSRILRLDLPILPPLVNLNKCCQNEICNLVCRREDLERGRAPTREEATVGAVVLCDGALGSVVQVEL